MIGHSLRSAGIVCAGLILSLRPATAQECTGVVTPSVNLGIGTIHCQGGSCLVAGASSTVGNRLPEDLKERRSRYRHAWGFSVEPWLWDIAPDGPTAGLVEEGDVLVAVNDAPITTRQAGLDLTLMQPGKPLLLTLRRNGVLTDVSVDPVISCFTITASAGTDEMPYHVRQWRNTRPTAASPAAPSAEGLARFEVAGITLAGVKEVRVNASGAAQWWFRVVPVITEVRADSPADRAGIRVGDRLIRADGHALTSQEGTAALAGLRAGRSISVRVRQGTKTKEVVLNGG